jgi:hypothetical protein
VVLTSDPRLSRTFTQLWGELGIETHTSWASRHASDQLTRTKFEGVLLDFDTILEAHPIFREVKESASNRKGDRSGNKAALLDRGATPIPGLLLIHMHNKAGGPMGNVLPMLSIGDTYAHRP